MSTTKLGEATVNTNGSLPVKGSVAPDFTLTGVNLKDVTLKDFAGKNVVLNIFPSIDTNVCAASVREFNKQATSLDNTVVLSVSKDLPFAMKRFCAAEGINKVILLSEFKDKNFSNAYGIEMIDGHFIGLHARAVVVIGPDGKIKYTELVPSIGEEPDYDAAIEALK